ncbi:MAG: prepilin-type N-terminal cleavage/methylation domain-containing protein [Proteobacteria bacterium]|nr:prepilin-type N-terminal cleavage/methylation domain-containing protein [Pseudomonadota bacterium]
MNDTRKIAATESTNQRGRPASGRGFTLLELLISLTLLVVIVVIAMGAMRLGSRSVAAGEKKMDDRERFRTVLSLIDAQIRSQLPLTYEAEGGRKYYFRGDGKTLRFPTSYSIWSGRKGYVIVDYRIEADGSGREFLSASEQVPGIEGQWNTPLLEANGLSLDYFYRDPTEEEGTWRELLPEGPIIPEKIRFRLTRGQEQLTLVFPVMVRHGIMPLPGEGNP